MMGDGREGPYAPTVGMAYARSVFFILSTDGKYAKILTDGKCSHTDPYAPFL